MKCNQQVDEPQQHCCKLACRGRGRGDSYETYLSYKISKNFTWILGADNIFNVLPDLSATAGAKNASWGDSESGGPFDAVQMGYNGTRIFTKVAVHF